VKLFIFAYTRVICTSASLSKFVAGAHSLWRLTAASALALPVICLCLCLLQATFLHPATAVNHTRFLNTHDHSLFAVLIPFHVHLHETTSCRSSPAYPSYPDATGRHNLSNSLNPRCICSHFSNPEKSARLVIPIPEKCAPALHKDALHNFEYQQARGCSSRSKRWKKHDIPGLTMLSGIGGQQLYVLRV